MNGWMEGSKEAGKEGCLPVSNLSLAPDLLSHSTVTSYQSFPLFNQHCKNNAEISAGTKLTETFVTHNNSGVNTIKSSLWKHWPPKDLKIPKGGRER